MASLVVLSGGGIKGAVSAARYANDHELCLVHVDFGQPSAKMELEAIRDFARTQTSARVLALQATLAKQLEHPFAAQGGVLSTVVDDNEKKSAAMLLAYRGLIPTLFAIGMQTAMRLGASTLVAGVSRFCRVDHLGLSSDRGRPDQLREIAHAMNLVADAARPERTNLKIETPLMDLSYAEIVKLGARFEAQFERTWTCDDNGKFPCGTCERCSEREHGFREAKMADPLIAKVIR